MLALDTLLPLLENKKDRYLNQLFELLRIPSVSADAKYHGDVLTAAGRFMAALQEVGVEARLIDTPGNPIVYGEYGHSPDRPTVLVYGHYDVQPPDPTELWNTPPFEPEIRDGKIYARGACDDKGQVFMHLKAFELMGELKDIPSNVKFLIEGEEEVGSTHLADFVKKSREMLACDCVLISDTSMLGNDTPSINTGLRGLSYVEFEVTGPNRDLHSGVFGGAVGNPVNILCELIGSLKNDDQVVAIPGFYDDVLEVSQIERAEMARAPFALDDYLKELDIQTIYGENGYTAPELTSIRPTLDVNGIWGGYTGAGAKTVLPSKAYAKISMRLVPNQSSEKITKIFTEHLIRIAPPAVKIKVTPHHGGEPSVTPTDSYQYRAAAAAMKESFGKDAIPQRSGGSIPVVALFQTELKVQSVLLGFGLDTDDIHSPNEHFGVFNFFKGIETIVLFHKHLFREWKQATQTS